MKTKKTINILFCGTGGQGVLTAAEIIALASMYDGYHTKKSEVHGMAQRGGSVESHVRFVCDTCDKVSSPLIETGQADFLVPFYKSEHDRLISFLAPKGVDMLADLQEALNIPNKKFVNTFMLGRLSKHLNISETSWMRAIEVGFKGKLTEENKKVFAQARSN